MSLLPNTTSACFELHSSIQPYYCEQWMGLERSLDTCERYRYDFENHAARLVRKSATPLAAGNAKKATRCPGIHVYLLCTEYTVVHRVDSGILAKSTHPESRQFLVFCFAEVDHAFTMIALASLSICDF